MPIIGDIRSGFAMGSNIVGRMGNPSQGIYEGRSVPTGTYLIRLYKEELIFERKK